MKICTKIVFFTLTLLACSAQQNKRTVVQINGHKIIAEVANTQRKAERGLMFRKKLPPNSGMLFVFNTEEIRGFWMKNTYIPLSVAYIDYTGRIREIYDLTPRSLIPVTSLYPFRYALEVNKGYFHKMGIRVGDRVRFSAN